MIERENHSVLITIEENHFLKSNQSKSAEVKAGVLKNACC